MKQVRVKILSGEYKGAIGIMDSLGHITFSNSDVTFHNSTVKWEFADFKQNKK